MTIVRFNPNRTFNSPVRPFSSMYQLMDDLFVPEIRPMAFTPQVNVVENRENYRIELALPGFKKSEIQIEFETDTLKIAGKREENRNAEDTYKRREFHSMEFEKSFVLPEDANTEKISAMMENGILFIHLPKKEEALPKPPRAINVA